MTILTAILTMTFICGLCACGTKNTSENSQAESANAGEEGKVQKGHEDSEQEKSAETENAEWATGTLTVNGDKITLPCTFEDIEALGYTIDHRSSYRCTNSDGQWFELMRYEQYYGMDFIIIEAESGSIIDIDGVAFGMTPEECEKILGEEVSVSDNELTTENGTRLELDFTDGVLAKIYLYAAREEQEGDAQPQSLVDMELSPGNRTATGSKEWTNGTFVLNGESITLPGTIGDLEALGYSMEELSYGNYNCTNSTGQSVEIFQNQMPSDVFQNIDVSAESGNTIDLDGVTFGMSIYECIEILGGYYSLYEGGPSSENYEVSWEDKELRYIGDEDQGVRLFFDKDNILYFVSVSKRL